MQRAIQRFAKSACDRLYEETWASAGKLSVVERKVTFIVMCVLAELVYTRLEVKYFFYCFSAKTHCFVMSVSHDALRVPVLITTSNNSSWINDMSKCYTYRYYGLAESE